MENSYGIGTANRYALFLNDDDTDPIESLTLKEQEKELKKKSKVAEKENKVKTDPPAKTKPAAGPKKTIKENTIHKNLENKREDNNRPANHQRSNIEGKPERSFNKFNSENREERNNRRNREDRVYNGPSENREREERPRRENTGDNFDNRNRDRGERGDRVDRGERADRGERGERGDRVERGERGERGGRALGNKPAGPRGPRRPFEDRRGKREFDRQSGSDKTGVKPIDKRDGAGAHNWGSHKDVIEEADKPNNESDQSWNDTEKPEVAPAPEQKEENEVEGSGAPTEEEPKELTLDEWKAQRAGRAKPQYNIRKAGEGEDPTQWKKMYELRKKENESESEDEEYDAAEYPQRVGRQKHVLDIDIQFNDTRRGGGRGRGQRSGPRGNRASQRGGDGAGGGRGAGSGGPGVGSGSGPGNGGGSGGGPVAPVGERPERRYRDDQGSDEKNENRRAPKVDDERDFPSLG